MSSSNSLIPPLRHPRRGPTLAGRTSAAQIALALGAQKSGENEWLAKCPSHDDHKPSLSISEGQDGSVLVYCHAGCTQTQVINALKTRGLWLKSTNEEHVAEYNYTDKHGNLVYQIVRKSGKRFSQRYPDGEGGWTWKKHPHQVLYRLQEVLKANRVYVVEGEKDADTMRTHGYVASTNAGGANAAWLPEFTSTLRGKDVVLVPDNDPPGWQRALTIARALIGHAKKITVRSAAGGAKDVSDWYAREPAPACSWRRTQNTLRRRSRPIRRPRSPVRAPSRRRTRRGSAPAAAIGREEAQQ